MKKKMIAALGNSLVDEPVARSICVAIDGKKFKSEKKGMPDHETGRCLPLKMKSKDCVVCYLADCQCKYK